MTLSPNRNPRVVHRDFPEGPAVMVELVNRPGSFACLDPAAYASLVDRRPGCRFFANTSGTGHLYVRTSLPTKEGGTETVARLLLEPARGWRVRYRNGDRADLRRANLYLERGYSKAPPPDFP